MQATEMTDRIYRGSTPRYADHRSPWQRDRARILHSAAFRRLQSKTQVLGVGGNDFFRTRLTHSLEVAQIGSGIINQLRREAPQYHPHLPNNDLIESLCLAHDIGHPPFGHGGEVALNFMMREHGGFEGNAQTFRILTKLEPYTQHHGMNLSRRTLLGIIKYPSLLDKLNLAAKPKEPKTFRELQVSEWSPAKGVYKDDQNAFDWVLEPFSQQDQNTFISTQASAHPWHLKTRYKSLDCSIMELADDIAYGVHDLEDGIMVGIIKQQDWNEHVLAPILNLEDCWLSQQIEHISKLLFSPHHYEQKDGIGHLVNGFITSISLCEQEGFENPLIKLNATMQTGMSQALDFLKQFVLNFVIHTPEVERVRFKGQQIVMELYQAFASDPERLLPLNTRQRWLQAENGHRVIADYLSGMTDGYANRIYQEMF